MCYVWIAYAAVAAASALKKHAENNSEAKAYESQADAYSNEAHQQIQQGSSEAYQETRKARSAASSQNAAMGANGVVSSSGSALRTLQDTFQQGQDASSQIQKNAYGKAETTQYQANIALTSAKNAKKNNLMSSLLTGGSTYLGMGGGSSGAYTKFGT